MTSHTSLSRRKVTVNGEHISLRTLLPDDASERYASWLNDPVVNQYLETRSITIPKLRAYIGEKWESDQALLLGVFWKETGAHIGNVKLEPVDLSRRTALLGLLIGDKEFWGRGVGTEATNLAVDFALKDLGLREIRLGVIAENTPAIRVYEKCGFTVDHIEKNGINHDGVLHDKIHMIKKA